MKTPAQPHYASTKSQPSSFIKGDEVVAPSSKKYPNGAPVLFQDQIWIVAGIKSNPDSRDHYPFDFSFFPDEWQVTVKEIIFYSIHPNHPVLIEKGLSALKKPVAPRTVVGLFHSFKTIYRWAAENHLAPVSEWGKREADLFLSSMAKSSPSTTHQIVGAYRNLNKYHLVLTSGGLPKAPWPSTLSNSKLVGHKAGQSLKTSPLPPKEWVRAVTAAWKFVDEFSDPLLEARQIYTRSFTPLSSNLPTSTIEEKIRQLPFILVTGSKFSDSKQNRINYLLLRQLLFADRQFGRTTPTTLTPKLRRIFPQEKFLIDSARNFARYFNESTSEHWLFDVSFRDLIEIQSHIQTACYIIISAFTMMRDSEIRAIPRDPIVNHHGIPAIHSKKFKRNKTAVDYYWWISEPVERAIDVLSQLTSRQDRLFGTPHNRRIETVGQGGSHHRAFGINSIEKFTDFVNSNQDLLNLEPINEIIHARALRRTMATIIGGVEDGQIALSLQLKHATSYAVANSLTSAYAEPDSRWAQEVAQSRHSAAVNRLVDDWTESSFGHFSGPPSAELNKMPQIGDPKTLTRWLNDKFPNVRLGTFNHCLGDSSQAACLTPEEREKGIDPKPAYCHPGTCANAFCSPEQQSVIATEQDMLRGLLKKGKSTGKAISTINQRIKELERLSEIRHGS